MYSYAPTHTKKQPIKCVCLQYSYFVHVGYRSYASRSRAKSICLHIQANTNNCMCVHMYIGTMYLQIFISLLFSFTCYWLSGVRCLICSYVVVVVVVFVAVAVAVADVFYQFYLRCQFRCPPSCLLVYLLHMIVVFGFCYCHCCCCCFYVYSQKCNLHLTFV